MRNFRSVHRKPSGADNDLALFLSRWIRAPLRIGALAPSSKHLGREMARAIDVRKPDPVIELGGGTGRITRALLEAGRPHQVLPLSGVTHMTPQEVVTENILRLELDFLRRALTPA